MPSVLEALVDDGVLKREGGRYVLVDEAKAEGIIAIVERYLPKEYKDVSAQVIEEFLGGPKA